MRLHPPTKPRGATLMESVIAIGVLASAVPMVLVGMLEAGRGSEASGAETRAPWIVRASIKEWRATGTGDTAAPIAFAFSRTGALMGAIDDGQHATGLRRLGDSEVHYIATIHAPQAASGDSPPNSATRLVSIEFPAAAPAAKRRTLDFHFNSR